MLVAHYSKKGVSFWDNAHTMAYLYTQFLYRPLLNLLFFLYNNVYADLGVAIILLTIIVRVVLLPLFYKSAKDQTILQKIAPRIQELQKIHKEDKERQVKEIMAVYKEHRVNPKNFKKYTKRIRSGR